MAWQRRTLAEVMGQRVIYRNLEPVASDLPGLGQLWSVAGLQECTIPRKTTREYAHVVWLILEEAQRLRGSGQPIERMLMIGDSARNDGAVARNVGLEHATRAFIGLDAPEVPRDCTIQQDVMTANRWDALEDMLLWLQDTGFACDERLAVLVDIDKTIIGARGRNDRIIDLARVRAAESTARSAIGADLDVEAFRSCYARLNRPDCHWLTEDNQDYVAYLSIMVAGGACAADSFWAMMVERQCTDVAAFAAQCDRRIKHMPAGLAEVHREVSDGLRRADPTPFKSFRRHEYLETIALMDVLPSDAPAADVLNQEIVITAEVLDVCQRLAGQGALVFGLSDKPDEASLPTAEMARQGGRGIHDTPMKVYGPLLR